MDLSVTAHDNAVFRSDDPMEYTASARPGIEQDFSFFYISGKGFSCSRHISAILHIIYIQRSKCKQFVRKTHKNVKN